MRPDHPSHSDVPSSEPDLSVGFLLAPEFTLLAFSGFVESLRLAADVGDRSRPIRCRWTVMGPDRRPVRASCGVEIAPWETFRDPTEFHYVVIVGGLLSGHAEVGPAVFDYLRRAAAAGVPLVGVCSGSFLLARAGLMRRRRCSVHWYLYPEFVREFPDAVPVTEEIFVVDGDRITCAGGASVADLALHLIQRHCGEDWALKSLRLMLRDWARPPNHPQPPFVNEHRAIHDPRVRKAIFLMEQNMAEPLAVEDLAGQVHTSVRQLERLFREQTGESPSTYYRSLRLRYAHWLLTESRRPVTEVAYDCGFADGSHFARSFKQAFGRSPASVRKERRGHAAPPLPPAAGAPSPAGERPVTRPECSGPEGHDWQATPWGVVVGVSRCRRCGRLATPDDVGRPDFDLAAPDPEGSASGGWERATRTYREARAGDPAAREEVERVRRRPLPFGDEPEE
ncbi:MAG: GlxA family transcriptional regulator [Deferrisomatales bacterium]